MSKQAQKHPAHVSSAALAIALMALGLAAGLDFVGTVDHLNRWMSSGMMKSGLSEPAHTIHPYLLWGGTCFMSLGLTLVMLNVSSIWRRLLIWVLVIAVTWFWVPVLLLASRKPEIGVAVVAILWSGVCAMVYTMNHEMPADQAEPQKTTPEDGTR